MAALAKILILHPPDDVRELIALSVARLGHEAVVREASTDGALPDVDVVVVEPSVPSSVTLVQRLRRSHPAVPVICVSIEPRTREVDVLTPFAYLLKPFHLRDLERALVAAIAELSARDEP